MFYTYILYSAILDRYYIGYTAGTVELRLAKHLLSKEGFTSKAKDWKVVYIEVFENKVSAMQRESQLKSWKNKTRIKELIDRSSIE
jgi:putative endonuclease